MSPARWAAVGLAAAVVAFVLAPTMGSPLGPVDDYEMAQIHRQLAAEPFGAVLAAWVADPVRVRPLYWVLRVVEVAVWGDNAFGFHLDRLALAWLTLGLGTWIAVRWLPLGAALLVGLAVVIGPQAEGFYRLGTMEAFATPLALGSVVASMRGRPGLGIVLALLAGLTKEPYAVFAPVLLAIAWWYGARWWALVGAGVALAGLAAWIASGLHYFPNAPQGRYVLPWMLLGIPVAVLALRRWPLAARAALACWLTVFTIAGATSAAVWAQRDHAFSEGVAAIRARLTPGTTLVVQAGPDDYEAAFAVRAYLPDGDAMLAPVAGAGQLADWQAQFSRDGGRGYRPLASADPRLTARLADGRVSFP